MSSSLPAACSGKHASINMCDMYHCKPSVQIPFYRETPNGYLLLNSTVFDVGNNSSHEAGGGDRRLLL